METLAEIIIDDVIEHYTNKRLEFSRERVVRYYIEELDKNIYFNVALFIHSKEDELELNVDELDFFNKILNEKYNRIPPHIKQAIYEQRKLNDIFD